MTLEEAKKNIGRNVIYTPFEGAPPEQLEYGIITNVTEIFVFVRYGKEIISKATTAEKLKF